MLQLTARAYALHEITPDHALTLLRRSSLPDFQRELKPMLCPTEGQKLLPTESAAEWMLYDAALMSWELWTLVEPTC